MKLLSISLGTTLVALMLGACGGTEASLPTSDGGAGDASRDDASAKGDGGCVNPIEGQSCSAADTSCAQDGDPCCIGYVWSCVDGAWKKMGLGCACHVEVDAGPFACGSTTCQPNELCEVQPPGIAFPDGGTPPTTYTCRPIPSDCASNPTCACIETKETCPVASCTTDGGNVTVSCIGE